VQWWTAPSKCVSDFDVGYLARLCIAHPPFPWRSLAGWDLILSVRFPSAEKQPNQPYSPGIWLVADDFQDPPIATLTQLHPPIPL